MCCLVSVAIMMFITNMEIPVLITALVAITEDLGGFGDVSWVLSSYLLGYVGMSEASPIRKSGNCSRHGSRSHHLRQVQ